ncbi:MAG: CDGSH iron-sulfur domain-containing protein [Balneola sp.]|tara:strand:- start:70696 stop:71358 length:663 start_codon:yes stop_codon:yes gene_type:complete
MQSKKFSYENKELEVTWDLKRCIHAKECVHGLPDVFNPEKKPWIDPDKEPDSEKIMETIERCPTGALQYHFKNKSNPETPPSSNKIIIDENGPLYVHGNIILQDNDGNELLRETRLAFCRCGKSSNKPLCDNSHIKAEFEGDTSYNPERLELEPQENEGGELLIKLIENAPFVVEGNYEVIGGGQSTKTCKRMSFCRCGASENKPFCDGTHRQIEFKSDD